MILLLAGLGNAPCVLSVSSEPIDVLANSLFLDAGIRIDGSSGTLIYRGGFELVSSDSRFGGFSGVAITSDGATLVAISDRGWWFQATLGYDQYGNLDSVNVAELIPMRSVDGHYVDAGVWSDAEALLRLPNGEFVVAFERHHRLWRYSDTRAAARSMFVPSIFAGLPYNRGIEALAMLDEGRSLVIAESGPSNSSLSGWVLEGTQAEMLYYPYDGYFRPSDAVRIDDHRILVLERGYTEGRGVAVRLMLLDVASVIAGARLQPSQFVELGAPIPLDNFEGVAARRDPGGALLIYLLSDDNYSSRQQTLLLMFEFAEAK